MDIRQIAYEKYKLQWMISHGYTIPLLIEELVKVVKENPDGDIHSWFADWELNRGFSSDIWCCYEEFLETEFVDDEYIKTILTKNEFLTYLEFITNRERTNEDADAYQIC